MYASMYRENVHAIHIAMQFAKNRDIDCIIKIDSQQQRTNIGVYFTSHGARVGLGLRL